MEDGDYLAIPAWRDSWQSTVARETMPGCRRDQQILEWADAHQRRTGAWPTHKSGSIAGTQGDNWLAVNAALCYGHRGQRSGSSLAKLLAKHRGARNPRHRQLTVQQILTWADAFRASTGHWPNENSGPVADARYDELGVILLPRGTGDGDVGVCEMKMAGEQRAPGHGRRRTDDLRWPRRQRSGNSGRFGV